MDLRSKNSCRKNGPTIGKRIRNTLRGRLKLCSFHSNGFAPIHSGPSLSLSPRGVCQDGSRAVPDAGHHLHLESSIHTAEKQCVITLFVSDLLTATGVSYAVYEQQMGFPPVPAATTRLSIQADQFIPFGKRKCARRQLVHAAAVTLPKANHCRC